MCRNNKIWSGGRYRKQIKNSGRGILKIKKIRSIAIMISERKRNGYRTNSKQESLNKETER